jgi:hypothetical protein
MSVNTSITGALVVLIIVVLAAGLIMGLAFAETDIFNPRTSKAEAHQIQQDTDYENKKRAIELEHYQRELEAQATFEEQQRQLDLEKQRKRQALDLAWGPIRQAVLLAVVISIGSGLTYYLVSIGHRARRAQADPWQSPIWRENMRRIAQLNEYLLRTVQSSRQPSATKADVAGNGREREPILRTN